MKGLCRSLPLPRHSPKEAYALCQMPKHIMMHDQAYTVMSPCVSSEGDMPRFCRFGVWYEQSQALPGVLTLSGVIPEVPQGLRCNV